MNPTLHILATVRKPELLDAALLVFKTLRTGFPDAPVRVWGNALPARIMTAVVRECARIGAQFDNLPATVHDAWIESLVEESQQPFWICDTDVVFFDRVPAPPPGTALSGRFESACMEDWTQSLHAERLHTALLYFNPSLVRTAMRAYRAQVPAPWGESANFPFIRQHFIPTRGSGILCYDTCAGLWQAGIGTPFTEEQNDAYEHLHCATYADLIDRNLDAGKLRSMHDAVYQNPERARGLRRSQEPYYQARLPKGPLCLTTPE